MKISKGCVVLAAGGTGGHLFPAQALAKELVAQGRDVKLLTDKRGEQFNDASLPTIVIPVGRLDGSLSVKIKGVGGLIHGIIVSLHHLRRLKPQVVVGFGGHTSFPPLVAAALLRIPTLIHQADAYLGRANRLLVPFMTGIATSFPHVEKIPTSCHSKITLTGLPLRPDIKPADYMPIEDKGPIYLLITGGSQGARVFSEIVPKAIHLLEPHLQSRLHITQQCRPESLQQTQMLYKTTSATVELSPFLDNMGERYKKAHLIISRAGASSVSEAALVGRPAILVPYPYATDDHQSYNARQAVEVEGGWMIQEKDLTPEALAALLSDLINSPWQLQRAAVNMRSIITPDASRRLADLVTHLTAQKDT